MCVRESESESESERERERAKCESEHASAREGIYENARGRGRGREKEFNGDATPCTQIQVLAETEDQAKEIHFRLRNIAFADDHLRQLGACLPLQARPLCVLTLRI